MFLTSKPRHCLVWPVPTISRCSIDWIAPALPGHTKTALVTQAQACSLSQPLPSSSPERRAHTAPPPPCPYSHTHTQTPQQCVKDLKMLSEKLWTRRWWKRSYTDTENFGIARWWSSWNYYVNLEVSGLTFYIYLTFLTPGRSDCPCSKLLRVSVHLESLL